jgi:hypothetical protein
MSEGTTTAGGFGIPVFIDPSIILTAQGSDNPFLSIARQVDVNTNAWKGVSSAGVSWSFDAEAAAVSDDSPTLAQPKVDVFMARGFIPYSIEVGEDYPGFASEMSTLLSSGYDELLVDKFTRGSGSGEPMGIVTALDADTTVEVLLGTAGTLAAADIYNVWAKLPQRFRRKASWLGAVEINNKIRQLGTANNFHATTVQLSAESAEVLMNKQWYETPYMTDLTSTAHTNVAVVGDFSNYVVARRGGMSVELVPSCSTSPTTVRPGSAAGSRTPASAAARPTTRASVCSTRPDPRSDPRGPSFQRSGGLVARHPLEPLEAPRRDQMDHVFVTETGSSAHPKTGGSVASTSGSTGPPTTRSSRPTPTSSPTTRATGCGRAAAR